MLVTLYMYFTGGVYFNKLRHCKHAASFCGLQRFHYKFPKHIEQQIINLTNSGVAKRVNIPKWKAGSTIPTETIHELAPGVIEWYTRFGTDISKIVGADVQPTSLSLPTSCSILIYDNEFDFINWHFDVNYYKGRFFTILLPITNEETCTQFVYRDPDGNIQKISIGNNLCVAFEGDIVFHMASKLCANQKRAILSLQYSTDPSINPLKKIIMRLKDTAYVGV
jgi:hypothetical protein